MVTPPATQTTPAAAEQNAEGNQSSNGRAVGHQKHRNHAPPGQLRKAENPPPHGLALGHRKHYPPGQARKAERSHDGKSENDDDQGEDSKGNSGQGDDSEGNNGHEHSGHGRGNGG
ncbi:MAG TPA: hypothetical protein VJ838_14195 [Gaiellaceae bacterium]|nr:hypothetical protein [Gaiellaceae bacterium]